jgi:hypothetical protein
VLKFHMSLGLLGLLKQNFSGHHFQSNEGVEVELLCASGVSELHLTL